MTVEEHLRIIIGDLVIKVAQLSADNDALKAAPPPPPDAEEPNEQPAGRN